MNEYHLSAMCRGIALLADVRRDAGVTALMRLCCGAGDPAEQYADYWRALAAENRTDDATAYMREAILNAAFTVTDKTRAEFERELDVLYKLSRLTAADFAALKDIAADLPALSCGTARPFSAVTHTPHSILPQPRQQVRTRLTSLPLPGASASSARPAPANRRSST